MTLSVNMYVPCVCIGALRPDIYIYIHISDKAHGGHAKSTGMPVTDDIERIKGWSATTMSTDMPVTDDIERIKGWSAANMSTDMPVTDHEYWRCGLIVINVFCLAPYRTCRIHGLQIQT